jgi:WhiB family redox-sensing transcriptional regulator
MAGEMILSNNNQPILLPSLNKWGDDEWRKSAECKGADTNDFFLTAQEKVREMKKLCNACGVRTQCLNFALENEISWGIYGGMTAQERNKAFKHVVSRR